MRKFEVFNKLKQNEHNFCMDDQNRAILDFSETLESELELS